MSINKRIVICIRTYRYRSTAENGAHIKYQIKSGQATEAYRTESWDSVWNVSVPFVDSEATPWSGIWLPESLFNRHFRVFI